MMGGKTKKVGLAAILTTAAAMGAEMGAKKKPKRGVQTDEEGMQRYLLRQAKLEVYNKPSKRKMKRTLGKKKKRRK